MKRFCVVLATVASCLWHLAGPTQAQPDKAFLGKPIKVTLKNTDMSFETKYGQRTVTGYRVATDKYELRLSVWTLMGEPVEHYVFRMPRVNSLIFEADGGYKKTVTIQSADESKGQNYISESGSNIVASHILVSQDVLDKIKYVDLSFSVETIGLYPLSDAFYSGKDAASRDFFLQGTFSRNYTEAYINRLRNPGILGAPGKWGHDVPGSPSWSEFLSDKPFRIIDKKLPKDDYMDEKMAREAFRRMLWIHHVKKRSGWLGEYIDKRDLFYSNSFEIHHLNVNVNPVLDFIRKKRPDIYDRIMEKPSDKEAVKKDSETPTDMTAGDQVVNAKDKEDEAPTADKKKDINAPKEKTAWKSSVWDKFAGGEKGTKKDGSTSINAKTAASNSSEQKSRSGGPSGSLILLIDVSGSMGGTKLNSAKQAAINTVRKAVKNKTEIAILTFEGNCASPIHDSTGFSRNENDLITFVKGLAARGSTPLATALEATNRFMKQNKSASSRTQMILLLADGDDNCGNLDAVLSQLKQNNLLYRHETVGLEVSDSAQRQLQNIARQSGGKYHSATSQNLSKVFSDAMDLMQMLDMVGKFR